MTQNEAKKRRQAHELRAGYRAWKRQLQDRKAAYVTVPAEFSRFLRADTMGPSALRIYFYLVLSANRGGESWHAPDTIANDLAMSGRNVQRGLKELERSGLIARVRFSPKHRTRSFLVPFGSYVPSALQVSGETSEGADA